MIRLVSGDILLSDKQTLVNPVNTAGVMGAGLALQMKKAYPDMYKFYKVLCKHKVLAIGQTAVWRITNERYVLFFPTKGDNFNLPSKLSYIEKGFEDLMPRWDGLYRIKSAAFPLLGCGKGELNPTDVLPMMIQYLRDLPIPIDIFIEYQKGVKPYHVE